jgi:spore coat protein A, manganese oxidase
MRIRGVMRLAAIVGMGLGLAGAASGQELDPSTIPKFVRPLVIPPPMPRTEMLAGQGSGPIDYYEIAVRQLRQEILPPPFQQTTVWSYGSVNHPGTLNYPAFTIEAKVERPVRVKWINDLVDENGDALPHLLPVDPTLHWANPPGGTAGRDSRPTFASTPGPYGGPVPFVTHLHGGHSAQESDGFAEAWFLPAARDVPSGFATEGTWYDFFRSEFERKFGVAWEPGTATFQYENDQPPATLWYHDHTLGMTRLNVYAGPAGFYLLRHGRGPGVELERLLPGPAPGIGPNPFGRFYEIPIAIQDRSFLQDGSLFYPESRAFFDGFTGPFIPGSDVSPIWNPEFFGNTIVVNGRTWPLLEIEPRRYRFRFLNGCNSRFLILKIVTDALAERPAPAALPFWQIGADGEPVPLGWGQPITENPAVGATEIWEMYNFTEDAHPIHIHEVQFQVVNREPMVVGPARPPESWETGFKDTVIAYPGEITRVKARFDLPGLYVWHCHIVEHEDNEMMRPYFVGQGPPPDVDHPPATGVAKVGGR